MLTFLYLLICFMLPNIAWQLLNRKRLMRRKNPIRHIVWTYIFWVYCALTIHVTGIGTIWDIISYKGIAGGFNLIPFSSVGSMLATLWENPRLDVLWVVIYNLGGNIVMFLPLGFLLPELWQRCQQFWRCIGAVALIMTCVELVQLFTLRGFCETDDVMLNVLGGAIGFGIWHLTGEKA